MHSILEIDELTFSRGVIKDAAILAEFAARTFEETFARDNRPDDLRVHLEANYGEEQQTAELVDPHVVTILVCSGSALVAFAQVRLKSSPPCVYQANPVELHRFYLDRSTHGMGLAPLLMQEVYDATLELGGRHVWLGVWERNPRAIAFYKKCGFTDVGSQTYMVGPDKQKDRVLVVKVEVCNSQAR